MNDKTLQHLSDKDVEALTRTLLTERDPRDEFDTVFSTFNPQLLLKRINDLKAGISDYVRNSKLFFKGLFAANAMVAAHPDTNRVQCHRINDLEQAIIAHKNMFEEKGWTPHAEERALWALVGR